MMSSERESRTAATRVSSSGSSMAFIIDFDDVSANRVFTIDDSIRSFAPPKPDSIEKPRPQKGLNGSHSDSSPTTHSIKSNDRRIDNSSNNSSHVGDKHTDRDTDLNGHLSDSANYLIHRMLCSEPTANETDHSFANNFLLNSSDSKENMDLSSKLSPIEDMRSPVNSADKYLGVSDDNNSESGTYTVELEKQDNDLQEARNKIDKIFGIFEQNETSNFLPDLLPETKPKKPAINSLQSLLFTRNADKNSSRVEHPISSLESNETKSQLPHNQTSIANSATFIRPKRKPLLFDRSEKNNNLDLVSEQSSQKDRIKSLLNSSQYLFNSRLNDSNTFPASVTSLSTSHNHSSLLNSIPSNPLSRSSSHSAPSTPKSPLIVRKLLHLQSKELPKASNSYNGNASRKNSWNQSNSDAEQYDLWSCNSDESTDQSKSSNSAFSRNDGNASTASAPSKMRFNRAFALRRARLGMETPGIPLNINKCKAPPNPTVKTQKARSDSEFSRNDGGRFSLRLPKANASNSAKSSIYQNNQISKLGPKEQINVNKFPLHRKSSDPNNRITNGNRAPVKPTLSDNDRYVNNRSNIFAQSLRQTNGLHKSASFADSKILVDNGRKNEANVRGITTFQVGKRFFSTKPHQMAQIESNIRPKNVSTKPDIMSISMISTPSHRSPDTPSPTKSSFYPNKSRELSALDSLVISAINQLSQKLRTNMRDLLERERVKQQIGSELRVMIDEVLPQVSSPERRLNDNNDNNVSRDLSNVLKNLKKVEQSFEVVSLLLEPNTSAKRSDKSRKISSGFFVNV